MGRRKKSVDVIENPVEIKFSIKDKNNPHKKSEHKYFFASIWKRIIETYFLLLTLNKLVFIIRPIKAKRI